MGGSDPMTMGRLSALTRPLRLPLQTGAGALRDLLAAAILGTALLVVAALAALLVIPAVMLAWGKVDAEDALALVVGPWVVAGAVAAVAVRTLAGGISSARTHRASDLVVTQDGVQVVGGRRDGLAVPWSSVDAGKSSIEPAITGRGLTFLGGASYRNALFLAIDGDPMAVAESADEAEDQALDAAFATVKRACAGGADPSATRSPSPGPSIVTCAACGAPASVDDAPSVRCASCGAAVAMPDVVRQRLQEANARAALAAPLERAVARVLDQPDAAATNFAIGTAGVLAFLAMGVVVGGTVALIAHRAPMTAGILGILSTAMFTTAIVLFAYARIADRRGLRSVTLGFTATASQTGPTCRRCAAPLPAQRGDSVLTRCVYCAAANVLAPGVARGVELRAANAELEDVMSSLRSSRRAAFIAIAASGGAAIVLGLLAVSSAL